MYFKYSKSAQKSAFIIATLYSLAFSVISSVIVSFIIRIITSNNYKYNDIISIIIGIACFVSFETVYLITKKGIYLSDDKLIIKNGYKEIGQGAFIDFVNTIDFKDIKKIEYIEKYEAIFKGHEKFFGMRNRNSSYVVLTVSSQPYNTLFYISAQNEKKLFETLNSKLK